jgi:TRAP-type mannitol/chloroaromatic compound transport system permease small subunit
LRSGLFSARSSRKEEMAKLKGFILLIENTNLWVGKIVSFFVVIAMIILVYEVTARYVFDAPTAWAHEVSRHFYGAQFMLAGAFGLLLGYHVISDVIVGRFKPRARAIVDIITSFIFFFYVAMLVIQGTDIAIQSVRDLETTVQEFHSPVWPVKIAIPLGGLLLFLQGIVNLIRNVYLVITGKVLL